MVLPFEDCCYFDFKMKCMFKIVKKNTLKKPTCICNLMGWVEQVSSEILFTVCNQGELNLRILIGKEFMLG